MSARWSVGWLVGRSVRHTNVDITQNNFFIPVPKTPSHFHFHSVHYIKHSFKTFIHQKQSSKYIRHHAAFRRECQLDHLKECLMNTFWKISLLFIFLKEFCHRNSDTVKSHFNSTEFFYLSISSVKDRILLRLKENRPKGQGISIC